MPKLTRQGAASQQRVTAFFPATKRSSGAPLFTHTQKRRADGTKRARDGHDVTTKSKSMSKPVFSFSSSDEEDEEDNDGDDCSSVSLSSSSPTFDADRVISSTPPPLPPAKRQRSKASANDPDAKKGNDGVQKQRKWHTLRSLERCFHPAFDAADMDDTDMATDDDGDGDRHPDAPVAREKEFAAMLNFCSSRVEGGMGRGGLLYVSGQPGIGKTLSVKGMLAALPQRGFNKAYVNGMGVTSAADFVSQLSLELGVSDKHGVGQRGGGGRGGGVAGRLRAAINAAAGKAGKGVVLVVIDELDVLVKKLPGLVHTLMGWACQDASSLVVVGLANTMDLLQSISRRCSSPRLARQLEAATAAAAALASSKCTAKDQPVATKGGSPGDESVLVLHFRSYTSLQLREIIAQRVRASGVSSSAAAAAFPETAVRLVAAKVAAQCGDARRALAVCRRATSAARAAAAAANDDDAAARVKVAHVTAAFERHAAARRNDGDQSETSGGSVGSGAANGGGGALPAGASALHRKVAGLPQHAALLLCALATPRAARMGVDARDEMTPSDMRRCYSDFCRRNRLPPCQHVGPLVGLLEGSALLRPGGKPQRRGGGGRGRGARGGGVSRRPVEQAYALAVGLEDLRCALREEGSNYARLV